MSAKEKSQEKSKDRKDLEEQLEEGLEDSFPASDPISVNQPTRTGEPGENRKAKQKQAEHGRSPVKNAPKTTP